MNFVNAPGFKTLYYIALGVVFMAIMIGLVRSAMASLKRTGGKFSSVFDEIIIGIIVIVGFIAFGKLSPDTVINWIMKPFMWIWDMLLQFLRFLGLPV